MFNSSLVLFLFFVSSGVVGQLLEEPPSKPSGLSKWSSDGFSYADLGTEERHAYFSVLYELNPKLHAELQGFYDAYRIANLIEFSARAKWYPTEKVYLFSGVGVQMQQTKGFGRLPIVPLRMFNGVGYEPNKNMTIEAVHDLNFNKNGAGLNATPSLFTLKGKYRF